MDRTRLAGAAFDALAISFTLGAVFAPPDPFTQLLYAGPAFAVAFLGVYLYGQQSAGSWWRRYAIFAGGLVVVGILWWLLTFTLGRPAASVHSAFLLAGVLLGAWLAYFGGWERVAGPNR
jgi:hypothetical protein